MAHGYCHCLCRTPTRYGTEPPEALPQHEISPGVHQRLLAGQLGGRVGRFRTVQPVQMIDFELAVLSLPTSFWTISLAFLSPVPPWTAPVLGAPKVTRTCLEVTRSECRVG